MQSAELHDISYIEYRAINRLVDAHLKVFQGTLRAVIAFGDILTQGNTQDIDLLEIVEGWQSDDRVVEYASTAELPLRGSLRLYFLEKQEFANVSIIPNEDFRKWVIRLLERVEEGYQIIWQFEPRFVDQVFDSASNRNSVAFWTAPASGTINMPNPLSPPPPTPPHK